MIDLNARCIQEIKGHTKHKILLVSKYVEKWLGIASNAKVTKSVCFIDGMCNAGIYKDGTLGTSTEVLKLFIKYAKLFPNIQYNLFCNDIDIERINMIKDVFKEYSEYEDYENINIYTYNYDVNDFIQKLLEMNYFFNYEAGAFTLLFLDPYNFGVIKLQNVINFLNTYYSELMYNYFSSDILRNASNAFAIEKQKMMIESMQGLNGYNNELNPNTIKEIIIDNFKLAGKRCFNYQFNISSNVELYNIIYATQKDIGIEKLKETLWELFDGDSNNYRTLKIEKNNSQFTLFDEDYRRKENIDILSEETICRLYERYKGKEIPYYEIYDYVLYNTMLKGSHIIKHVLNPMIENGMVEKRNKKGKRNYKDDFYIFGTNDM